MSKSTKTDREVYHIKKKFHYGLCGTYSENIFTAETPEQLKAVQDNMNGFVSVCKKCLTIFNNNQKEGASHGKAH